jgi:gamma-glutamylputrescine oxidase
MLGAMDPTTSNIPVWLDEPGPRLAPLTTEIDLEVLVVGGGIAGISIAHALAEQGCAVGLLEAGAIASAASGRNAGFLTLSPPEPYRELIALWGRDGARAMLQLGRRSHERVRMLARTLDIACDYRPCGSLRLARSPDEAEDLRASLPDLHADGFRVLECPVSGAVPAEAVSHFAAAFVTGEDGELHPVRYLHGLALHAIRRGARIHPHTPLRSARWSGGLWEARTPEGLARARTLVIAANAYAPLLCLRLAPLIAPRRGQMLATAPLEREVAARPTLAHWGYQYWRQLPDRRLLIGGWRDTQIDSEVGYEDRPTESIQQAIERGLVELVPEGVKIERRWAGIMGFARDGRPLVGWLDPEHHVAIAAGFTGHGLSMAPACAVDLAELLAWKRAPGIATLDPSRFSELREERDRLTALDATLEGGI